MTDYQHLRNKYVDVSICLNKRNKIENDFVCEQVTISLIESEYGAGINVDNELINLLKQDSINETLNLLDPNNKTHSNTLFIRCKVSDSGSMPLKTLLKLETLIHTYAQYIHAIILDLDISAITNKLLDMDLSFYEQIDNDEILMQKNLVLSRILYDIHSNKNKNIFWDWCVEIHGANIALYKDYTTITTEMLQNNEIKGLWICLDPVFIECLSQNSYFFKQLQQSLIHTNKLHFVDFLSRLCASSLENENQCNVVCKLIKAMELNQTIYSFNMEIANSILCKYSPNGKEYTLRVIDSVCHLIKNHRIQKHYASGGMTYKFIDRWDYDSVTTAKLFNCVCQNDQICEFVMDKHCNFEFDAISLSALECLIEKNILYQLDLEGVYKTHFHIKNPIFMDTVSQAILKQSALRLLSITNGNCEGICNILRDQRCVTPVSFRYFLEDKMDEHYDQLNQVIKIIDCFFEFANHLEFLCQCIENCLMNRKQDVFSKSVITIIFEYLLDDQYSIDLYPPMHGFIQTAKLNDLYVIRSKINKYLELKMQKYDQKKQNLKWTGNIEFMFRYG